MNTDTRETVVHAAEGEPWHCNDCGKVQQVASNHNSNGWYWVQLRPGETPVYLCIGCFGLYDQDWPDYVGTHESSAWRGGSWEGKWLWALPADYFERRAAFLLLPHWDFASSGWKLVTHDGQTLGWVAGYPGDVRKNGLYRALDAHREPLPDGGPMSLPYAMG
ncbi:hypothetical protein, partial [Streptomyces sp. NPDC056670]|uniref:hypothetical protein n=1 Tax=Streptomyces sp. NPDC056670 TaxID=3345904 RepID=UPI0036940690